MNETVERVESGVVSVVSETTLVTPVVASM